MVAARSSARLARLAGHVVVATSAAAAPWTDVDRSPPADASIDTDPSIWSSAELMRRATALGASDAQVDSALGASDTPAALVAALAVVLGEGSRLLHARAPPAAAAEARVVVRGVELLLVIAAAPIPNGRVVLGLAA
jgi:hypothetical protein